MRKLLPLTIFIVGLIAAAAAQTAVNRHYDYLQVEQENTRLERRLSALRANIPEEEGSALPAVIGAIAILLAASALVGQGGLVALLGNANRVIRSLRRPRSRARSRPPVLRPEPDRYIVRQPPALTDGGAGEEPSPWT